MQEGHPWGQQEYSAKRGRIDTAGWQFDLLLLLFLENGMQSALLVSLVPR